PRSYGVHDYVRAPLRPRLKNKVRPAKLDNVQVRKGFPELRRHVAYQNIIPGSKVQRWQREPVPFKAHARYLPEPLPKHLLRHRDYRLPEPRNRFIGRL